MIAIRSARAVDTNIEPRETVVAVLDRVTKSARGRVVLRDLSVDIRAREILAIVGPTGAGKTLLVDLLAGQCVPDDGAVRVFGTDPCDPAARAALGVMPQEISFPSSLRVREIAALVQAHYMFATPAAELILRFGLCEVAEKRAGQLRPEERRRLAFALTFAGNPELIVLDDPIGDAPFGWGCAEVWPLLRRYADQGGAIVLTGRSTSAVLEIADRIVQLHCGDSSVDGRSLLSNEDEPCLR